jgi:hypothetical protein
MKIGKLNGIASLFFLLEEPPRPPPPLNGSMKMLFNKEKSS